MNYSLLNHDRGYSIDLDDIFVSFKNCVSGSPYAIRHYELAYTCPQKHVLGHQILAKLEDIPILGALAALLERVIVISLNRFFPVIPISEEITGSKKIEYKSLINESRKLSQNDLKMEMSDEDSDLENEKDDFTSRMLKNTKKAIDEHFQQTFDKALIKTINELPYLNPLIADVNDRHLTFTHSVCEKIGKRSTMEDANFILNIEEGIVAGVFDGHGGEKVSQFVSIKFANRFAKRLNEHKGNVHKTFTNLINEIHSDVCNRINIFGGTTAVISFIDKKTSLIYTATLADSESNIYRKFGNKLKSIPLSCIRNWSSIKDAKRAAKVLNKPEIAIDWPLSKKPKSLRVHTLNVSRAIGDGDLIYTSSPTIIHKPKITINKVQSGDYIILACDGLKDYVSETEITEQIDLYDSENEKQEINTKSNNLAERLADFAINEKKSKDNVTVIALNVKQNA